MDIMCFCSKTPIVKGWSEDKKYCVTSSMGTKYLLRISPEGQYDAKKSEFETMQQVAALGVPMCLPLEFGTCQEGVYSLQSFIDGRDAQDVIPSLSPKKQYQYGIKAGEILQKIHSLPAPADIEDWEIHFNKKANRKIRMYRECGFQFSGAQSFIQYIDNHRNLLRGRPQTYQHGDYHIGNMMIDSSGELIIIDFNRCDFGDPWEEFNRIVWSAQAAPFFACGMVDGYFHGPVPIEFWQLLALYISSNTLSSIPWAIPFGPKEMDVMLKQASEVLEWYDNMQNPIPTWYCTHHPKTCHEKHFAK